MLTYNDLYEIFRKEKYSETLQILDKGFLQEFASYLKKLREEIAGESDLFADSVFHAKKQLENSIAIFRGLILRRKKKLLQLVFIAAETGIMKKDYENMFDFEKKIFDSLAKALEDGDKSLSLILNGKQENLKPSQKMIILNEDLAEFVDMEGKTIGPFQKGALINLNTKIADILVTDGKATLVDEN